MVIEEEKQWVCFENVEAEKMQGAEMTDKCVEMYKSKNIIRKKKCCEGLTPEKIFIRTVTKYLYFVTFHP